MYIYLEHDTSGTIGLRNVPVIYVLNPTVSTSERPFQVAQQAGTNETPVTSWPKDPILHPTMCRRSILAATTRQNKNYTCRMEALNVLRDESIRRRLDRHTLVAILDKDVMHIIVVSRDIEPIRLPDMVRNDLTTTSGAGGERRQSKTEPACHGQHYCPP